MASSVSGRRHRSTTRSRSSKRSTTSKRADDENKAPKTPDVVEIRRLREAYYRPAISSRRSSKQDVDVTISSGTHSQAQRAKVKDSPVVTRSSWKTQQGSVRVRPKKRASRVEEYVYGTAAPIEVIHEEVEDDGKHSDRSDRSSRHRSRRDSRSKKDSMLSVLEEEVTPDDSISQVASRKRRKRPATQIAATKNVRNEAAAPQSLPPSTTKRSSLSFGSIFRRSSVMTPAPKLVECLTCGSEIPSSKAASLQCGHRMCHDCLKRIFRMSVQDPAHMPPKCCTSEPIPLKYVDKLFDMKFKVTFNKKLDEYNTKNRIYCPNPKCGTWIRPAYYHTSGGRRYAQCNRCGTKACVHCGMRLHNAKDCPKDPEVAKLVKQAEEEGWKRCFSCKAMVELKEGCNHMTCRCRAEFCMACGAKWKTCDCPWFNGGQIADGDRLIDPFQYLYRQVWGNNADEGARPARTYQDELAERRRQERDDETLARRMQFATLLDDEPGRDRAGIWGVGNAAGHHMNDDHVVRQSGDPLNMNGFGDAAMGHRGERSSARRRAARQSARTHSGLVPNFIGEPSVLG